MKCEKCNKEISEKVEKYSKDKYNEALCFECQQTAELPQKTEGEETKDNKKIISRQATLKTACSIIELSSDKHTKNTTEVCDDVMRISDILQHYVKTGVNLLNIKK